MTGKLQNFIDGATAFRNLRDLAADYRRELIAAANAKARRQGEEDPVGTTVVQQEEGSSLDVLVDCEEYPGSPIHGESRLPSIQPNFYGGDYQDINDGPLRRHACPKNDDQEGESQAPAPYDAAEEREANFATSFAASFTTGRDNTHGQGARSKRHRDPQSPPPSSPRHPKKHDHPVRPTRQRKRGRDQPAGSGRGKGKGKSCDADWEWDAGVAAYKRWNVSRWEYWNDEQQIKEHWDGKKWHRVE